MPAYEFTCDNCGVEFTVFLNMDDNKKPLDKPCSKCGGKIYRIYSHGGFIDPKILKADKNMELSGVQTALERIRDNTTEKMNWKG